MTITTNDIIGLFFGPAVGLVAALLTIGPYLLAKYGPGHAKQIPGADAPSIAAPVHPTAESHPPCD